jgi:hypothetical protein
MKDNQTWNDCPFCGASWSDIVPTPGLIHRTRACDNCAQTSNTKTHRAIN